MAMKKVIIASDLDQIADVLKPAVHINNINDLDETNSILCEPGKINHFTDAIRYAVTNVSGL